MKAHVKILMVTKLFPPYYGGGAIQAIFLSRALRSLGYGIDFATSNFSNSTEKVEYDGFVVHKLRTARWTNEQGKIWHLILAVKVFLLVLR
jgi:hypothetical protein